VTLLEPQGPRERPRSRSLVALSDLSWRVLVCLALVAVVAWGLWQIRFVVLPVFIAFLLTTVLVPPAGWLRRRGVPPLLATFIVFVGAIATVGLIVALLAQPVSDEMGELGRQIRAGIDELGDWVAEGPFGLTEAEIQDTIRDIESGISDSAGGIASGLVSGAVLVVEVLATIVLILFLTFFFVKDGRSMWSWILRATPRLHRERVGEIGDAVWTVLSSYVRGIGFVATVDAVFIGLALALIGVPLVLPLAVITFFAAFFPIVGAVTAGAAAALVALVSNGVVDALLVVAAVVAVQQIEGNLLYPLVVGRTVELHPAVIIVAVAIGGVLGGILGAFLAVPVTAIISTTIPIARGRDPDDVVEPGGDVTAAAAP
jgi:predicted PurR-regulated permease PerM